MHTLYFTKINKADNSKDARAIAQNVLDSNGFAGENGFFSSSRADWYSIGGRWSGLFTDKSKVETIIKPMLEEELKERPNLIDYLYINPHLIDKDKRQAIDDISMREIGFPYFRDSYSGYEDDAVQITSEILKKLKEINCEICDIIDECIEDEYSTTLLDENCIGEWVVIIDYHN